MIEIIDDDDAVRDSTAALLAAHGFAVRCHPSAEHFLAAGGTKPDCLLIDQHMPGMTGQALIERLRARGDSTPAAILTARGDPALVARLAPLNVVVLHKPVAEATLVRWVTEALSRRKGGAE
jgi:two-component system, LuxR family, response regulator FixJ